MKPGRHGNQFSKKPARLGQTGLHKFPEKPPHGSEKGNRNLSFWMFYRLNKKARLQRYAFVILFIVIVLSGKKGIYRFFGDSIKREVQSLLRYNIRFRAEATGWV